MLINEAGTALEGLGLEHGFWRLLVALHHLHLVCGLGFRFGMVSGTLIIYQNTQDGGC